MAVGIVTSAGHGSERAISAIKLADLTPGGVHHKTWSIEVEEIKKLFTQSPELCSR